VRRESSEVSELSHDSRFTSHEKTP